MRSTSYRPDIDGLRAVAVLAVVAFHAFPNLVRSGFVGVDVFFVISGYLITNIIVSEIEAGRFSLQSFYIRRIKRIFPALTIVLIACYTIGWHVMRADQFEQLGKQIAAGAGFVINFVFWQEAGYFDAASDTKPLLHLWSLGVEEQFYALWPITLWLAWRWRVSPFGVTAAIAVLSFALNVALLSDTATMFYLPAPRFWELMVGALLAIKPLTLTKAQRDTAALAGFVLIASACFVIRESFAFPGLWALLPVTGAALMIGAGSAALFNSLILSRRWLVFIGLISYPLYLWHWPLLSFARVIEGEAPDLAIRVGAVVVSFALAWATYELVEKPIRFGAMPKLKAAGLSAAMLAICFLGLFVSFNNGIPSREAATQTTKRGDIGQAAFFSNQDRYFACTSDTLQYNAAVYEGRKRCRQSKKSSKLDFAIIGDSHAENLFPGFAEALPNLNVIYTSQHPGLYHYADIIKTVAANQDIRTVVISGRWVLWPKESTDFQKELSSTVAALSGKRVYLVDGIPEFPFDPTVCKYRPIRFFWQTEATPRCVIQRGAFNEMRNSYLRAIKASGAKVLASHSFFCDDVVCRMDRDGTMLYRDRDHLTVEGSRYLVRSLLPLLDWRG